MYLPSENGPRRLSSLVQPLDPAWGPVLIADDHEESRIITRMMLECVGHRVYEASNGLEALDLAFSVRPSAAILDIVMPGLDGWRAARRLRTDPRTSSMVLMAVTALAGATDRSRSLAAGFDTVLIKPVRPLAMVETLHASLRQRYASMTPMDRVTAFRGPEVRTQV
jgi:CheY-like chemotaxis protein